MITEAEATVGLASIRMSRRGKASLWGLEEFDDNDDLLDALVLALKLLCFVVPVFAFEALWALEPFLLPLDRFLPVFRTGGDKGDMRVDTHDAEDDDDSSLSETTGARAAAAGRGAVTGALPSLESAVAASTRCSNPPAATAASASGDDAGAAGTERFDCMEKISFMAASVAWGVK